MTEDIIFCEIARWLYPACNQWYICDQTKKICSTCKVLLLTLAVPGSTLAPHPAHRYFCLASISFRLQFKIQQTYYKTTRYVYEILVWKEIVIKLYNYYK
jgi:hypothetical protein